MDLYRLLQEEKNRLELREDRYNKVIEKMPEGILTTNKNGSYSKFYVLKEGKRQYISQDNAQLIEALAKKKYLMAELKDIQTEVKAIELYLKHHKETTCVEKLLEKGDGISLLLESIVIPEEARLKEWAEQDYPAYKGFPQDLIHEGPFGKMYRSKTEANIAYLLVKNRIPNRYEWEHLINGTSYPIDFTIRHPKTGKYYYWEHFGKMDDPSYCMKIGPKLRDFESVGIFPDVNLIMTLESKQFPMNISQLEEIVNKWFES